MPNIECTAETVGQCKFSLITEWISRSFVLYIDREIKVHICIVLKRTFIKVIIYVILFSVYNVNTVVHEL